MKTKKALITLTLLVFLLSVTAGTFAQGKARVFKEKKFYVVLSGAFNMVSDIGSDSDYIAGTNDFPVTPSHSEIGGGLGVLEPVRHQGHRQ